MPCEVRWGRANYFIASAHDSGHPPSLVCTEISATVGSRSSCASSCRTAPHIELLWNTHRDSGLPGELIFWRADTGAEVKRLKASVQFLED